MILGCILLEKFQAMQASFHFLQLIKYNQCFPGFNIRPSNSLQRQQDTGYVIIGCKQFLGQRFLIAVDVGYILKLSLTKVFHHPSFAYLTSTQQYQWFSFRILLPTFQLPNNLPFHGFSSFILLTLCKKTLFRG